MKKTLFASVFIMVSAISAVTALGAGGKIRFGNLAIVPSMGIDEIHDDNVYQVKRGKEAAWITHFRPGLMFDYTLEGRGKCQLGYSGDYAYFSRMNNNNWKNHDLFLNLDYLSPGGLILRIRNVLSQTSYIFGDEEEYQTGRQSERWADELQSAVGFKFSERFRLLTYYNYDREDYKNDGGGRLTNTGIYSETSNQQGYDYRGTGDWRQDYYSHEAGLGLETKITHKTWAFLRYYTGTQKFFTHRGGVTSANDASYNWRRVNSGLTWDSGGRLSGEINLGYQWNDHDNKHDQYGTRYKDKNNWIAATRFTFRQAEGRNIFFSLFRKQYMLDAGTSGWYVTTSAGVGIEQKFKAKYLFRLGYWHDINRFTTEGITPDYYEFTDRRKDSIHRIQTGLKYSITEWLSAGVDYVLWKNHSSDSSGGFTKNQFGVSLEFKPAEYH